MTTLVPAPITTAQREQIVTLHKQGLSRNAIAREAGVSAGTVTNVCRTNDLNFDRSQTKKATEGKRIDDKALRALIASDALGVVQSVSAILAGRLADNPDEIPTRDLVTMYGVLTDKHLAIVKTDVVSDNHSAVDAWLEHITGGTSGKIEE